MPAQVPDPASIQKIVSVANSILQGEIHALEGVRILCALHAAIDSPEAEDFYVLKAVNSETDHLPLGASRLHCSAHYLAVADEEIRIYLGRASRDIMEACSNLIRRYAGQQ